MIQTQFISSYLKKLDYIIRNDEVNNQIYSSIEDIITNKINNNKPINILLLGDDYINLIDIATKLGKIYHHLLCQEEFTSEKDDAMIKIAYRHNLIDQYIGYTASKTRSFLRRNRNKVVIFNNDINLNYFDLDTFSNESLREIIKNIELSNNKNIFIFIRNNNEYTIDGINITYKLDLSKSFLLIK